MKVPQRILEIHMTELGPIFLERKATFRERMSYWFENTWEWFTTLVVDDE